MSVIIHQGHVLDRLREMAGESVQCVVTSPPYYGLRDYGVAGQIGLEATPREFIQKLTDVFREVRRVLKSNGTLWVNMGDSYANDGKWGGSTGGKHVTALHGSSIGRSKKFTGLKPKDMMGMPWRLAFALQDDGWYLRSDIIWHKPNPMPESIRDRPTKAHEYLFLLTKSERYYYDCDAIKEPATGNSRPRGTGANPKCIKVPHGWDTGEGAHGSIHRDGRTKGPSNYNGSDFTKGKKAIVHRNVGQGDRKTHTRSKQNESFSSAVTETVEIRNKRSVWTIPTAPFKEAHFATFPPDLVKPCILAGSRPGDMVLDPFGGSGTTAMVAIELGRKAELIELNPAYAELARVRCNVTPGLGI